MAIIGAVSLFILEAVLIVALLLHRANRRRAEKAMRESQRLLQSTIDALDARVALLDKKAPSSQSTNHGGHSPRPIGQDGVGDGVGRNYLEICEKAPPEEARMVSKGMRRLLSGRTGRLPLYLSFCSQR